MKKAIFTAGYNAVLHIHSVVEECEIVELIEEIDTRRKKDDDPKKKKPKRKPLFVKNGAVVVCCIQVRHISQTCIQTNVLQFV
jgi:peptide chain release factor subunit 3